GGDMADVAAADEKPPVVGATRAFPVKLLIIVSVGAFVVGVSGGFVAIKFLGGSRKGGGRFEEEKGDGEVEAEAKREDGGKHGQAAVPGAMFDLDPFIVNLADTPDVRYLKLTLKLEVDNEAVSAELSARIPQMRDAILVLLSSKDVNAVRTTQGKF